MNILRYYIERFGPFASAAIVAALLIYYRRALVAMDAGNELDLSGLYAAVFDWSAIQTGFLFGVFGYVGGKSDGFIAEVKNTKAMKLFISYIRIAIILGFLLTLFCIPLMVGSFSIAEGTDWRYFTFVIWSLMSAWAFFAFLRVAYVFGILIRPDSVERIPG
jgi:hypothetical protein